MNLDNLDIRGKPPKEQQELAKKLIGDLVDETFNSALKLVGDSILGKDTYDEKQSKY